MKNRPLAFQIWIVIVCVTTGIFLLVSLLLPTFLSKNLSRGIYHSIEEEQIRTLQRGSNLLNKDATAVQRDLEQQDKRAVKSFAITPTGQPLLAGRSIPAKLTDQVYKEAQIQKNVSARYVMDIADERLYYVIRKVEILNRNVYFVSYMWDTYYKDLMASLIRQLIILTGILVLLSLFPAIWLSRYLSRPLVRLSGFVKSIANRQWNEPLIIGRKDEIGKLAESIEVMRDQLKRQDDYQKTMLQHISHELKTPVMVIRSYTQSIQDGIFPQGSLEHSLSVIEQESARLDRKIRHLLYLTKLDYKATGPTVRQEIQLDRLVDSVVERLRFRRQEISCHVKLTPAVLYGDPEQWMVAVENLLDNQIRYARSQVWISLTEFRGEGKDTDRLSPIPPKWQLTLSNDGPPVQDDILRSLFQPFHTGPGGSFGLGLAIVKRVADLHHADVSAVNLEDGVRFRIIIPVEA